MSAISETHSKSKPTTAGSITGALLLASLVAPQLEAAIVRKTLPPPGRPNNLGVDEVSSYTLPGPVPVGRLTTFQQTITPVQAGQTAKMTIDASVWFVTASGFTTSAINTDFTRSDGRLRDDPLSISVFWWNASDFNINDLSQGLVKSELVGREESVVQSGFNSTSVTSRAQTFHLTYNLSTPLDITGGATPTTYYVGFGRLKEADQTATDSRVRLGVQRPMSDPSFIAEAPADFALISIPGSPPLFPTLTAGTSRSAYTSIQVDIPDGVIPEPGGLPLALMSIGAGLARHRRRP